MRSPKHIIRFLSQKLPIDFTDYLARHLLKVYKTTGRPLEILDLGAGKANYWFKSPLKEFLLSTKSELFLIDAEDIFNQNEYLPGVSVKRSRGFIPSCLRSIDDASYDCVVAIDLIEHLPKHDGFLLMYEMDRISRNLEIILTPNGFLWQPPSRNNIYNYHISGWAYKEFKQFGFGNFRGQQGSKLLIGSYGISKIKSKSSILRELAALDQILSYYFYKNAASIIASKHQKLFRINLF